MAHNADSFHIIIAGASGAGRTLTFSRRRIKKTLCFTGVALVALAVGTAYGVFSSRLNIDLTEKLAETSAQLEELATNFSSELERKNEELASIYQVRIEMLHGELQDVTTELDAAGRRHAEAVQHYEKQLNSLRQDHETALEQSISKLNERSQAIESMMDRIGVNVKNDKKRGASGGPYIAMQQDSQRLLQQSGRYLELLRSTPLGEPVNGRMGSGFGRRLDPFSNKEAFHSGIDFEGKIGSSVVSTADGVVAEVGFDRAGYGHFVRVRHGNGYETLYAHLHKPEVRGGEPIKRGQTLGQLGNSGRSTGPHLHYEVLLKGQPIDPAKFVAAANSRKQRIARAR